MQIKIDLPETLALQLSQGAYPAAEVITRGLLHLEGDAASSQTNVDSETAAPSQTFTCGGAEQNGTTAKYRDTTRPLTTDNTTGNFTNNVPDVMDFLADFAQRRSALVKWLQARAEES